MHCYRMLGSFQDAEDVLQDTLLAAWQGLRRLRGARLAAHLALPDRHQPVPQRAPVGRPAPGQGVGRARRRTARADPARRGRLARAVPRRPARGRRAAPLGPEARYEQTESVSLAFVTALQTLPPRQVAVLILRDVLGFHADEVAEHARHHRRVGQERPEAGPRQPAHGGRRSTTANRRPPGSPAEDAVVARFVRAWESADLDALVALLTDDVFMSMPPMPFEYEGRDAVARFCAAIFGAGRRFDLVPDAGQRPAGVRRLPADARRHQPRRRPLRPHPRRRPDQRHDPLREQRPPVVRAPAFTPGQIAERAWHPWMPRPFCRSAGLALQGQHDPAATAGGCSRRRRWGPCPGRAVAGCRGRWSWSGRGCCGPGHRG